MKVNSLGTLKNNKGIVSIFKSEKCRYKSHMDIIKDLLN